ncbi:hypothetical protein ABBQ32_000857 [Trebouxia sp. C0010 RCD-2024]
MEGQSRSQAEAKHVVHDVQGRRIYGACEDSKQGQHCKGDQASDRHHNPAHATQQVGEWLGMSSPSIAELDCYLPAMSCKAVLTGFTSDLCTWAESQDAGLSVEQRQPDKVVIVVQRMLSSSYLAFIVRMDTAFTAEAKRLISMRQLPAHYEWWGEHTAGFLDMHKTTLCLIGMAGTKELLMQTRQMP